METDNRLFLLIPSDGNSHPHLIFPVTDQMVLKARRTEKEKAENYFDEHFPPGSVVLTAD